MTDACTEIICTFGLLLSLMFQACEGMHPKYPAALTLQARVMYHSGEADTAVAYQMKALAYYEQLEGLDSSQVWKMTYRSFMGCIML